jgi:Holliday junction DNA helicase RuvA
VIGFIKGNIKHIQDDVLLLMTESIGYEVFVPNALSYKINSSIELFIHAHWNQEQGPSLYGFAQREDKKVFQLALKCPGIGPRIALGIIESLGASSFIQAIAAEDIVALSSISGIGKKKAEQLIVQLKHQVAKLIEKGMTFQASNLIELQKVSEVLSSLNYSRTEINSALDRLKKEELENISFDVLLRKALSYLSKRA